MALRSNVFGFSVLVFLFFVFVNPHCVLGGRIELSHDNGARDVDGWWSRPGTPDTNYGIAVRFDPPAYPCFVREVSAFVNGTGEFRFRILDLSGNELYCGAPISAEEPNSWAIQQILEEIRLDSGGFYAVAEILTPLEPCIGKTADVAGGTSTHSFLWTSKYGIIMGESADVMIRVKVDQPLHVRLSSSSNSPRNRHFFIEFESPMDESTLNAENLPFTTTSTWEPELISGTYDYNGILNRLEFIPDELLDAGSLDLTISAGISDIYGNHPPKDVSSWIFVDDELDVMAPDMPDLINLQAYGDSLTASWPPVPFCGVIGHWFYFGPSDPKMSNEDWLTVANKVDIGNVTEYTAPVFHEGAYYRVGVSTYDSARNESEVIIGDCAPRLGSVLVVLEEPMLRQRAYYDDDAQGLIDAVEAGAFNYEFWREADRGVLPSLEHLQRFDAVLWSMGPRWVNEDTQVLQLLTDYMAGGGRLYYEARSLLSYTLLSDLFFPEWLHLTFEFGNSDWEAPVVSGAAGDAIGDGLELVYVTDRTARKEYFVPQDGAVPFLSVKDKPEEVCAQRFEDPGEYGYKVVFSTSLLSPIYTVEDRDKLLSRSLVWLQDKELDLRIATNTRSLAPYRVLELFVAANNIGEPVDVDAYLCVEFKTASGAGFMYFDGASFVSESVPFASNVRLERGLFLPRTKILEYLLREGLTAGEYEFSVGLMFANTLSPAGESNSISVFVRE
ncbi:hypothetical protein J7M28_05375 [bacterium]|nr:hypothetical protein [bacterium]